MARPKGPPKSSGGPSIGLIFLLALVLALAFYWWQSGMVPFWDPASDRDRPARVERPPVAEAPLPPVAEQPLPEYPMPELPEKEKLKPLPPVENSDGPILEALVGNFRADGLAEFINMQDYVRRLVITVDNLPRELVPSQMSMVQRIPNLLEVEQTGETITLSPRNYARYNAFVSFAQSLDPRLLVSLYLRFYPLLDQTYKEIGHPTGRFHDRVIVAIDDMLAAPEPKGPIELVQPKILYRFVDPRLQNLSAGQKIMIRIGPENAAQLKRALRRLRRELLGQPVN
jgi:hypothetical protein